jgi:hypothetical protein
MTIPTKEQWGKIDKDELDTKYALKDFLGKSLNQAKNMFKDNALHYGDSLYAMPYIPFNYYAPAMTEYIISEDAKNDSDGASSFLHSNIWLLSEYPEIVSDETKRLLFEASEHVANNQEFYDADIDIYGKFEDLFNKLKRVYKSE